jgi:hypothetical protein
VAARETSQPPLGHLWSGVGMTYRWNVNIYATEVGERPTRTPNA